MDAFFTQLGQTVLKRWKRENFSLAKFPDIACAALEERPPAKHVDLAAFTRAFLLEEEQPSQTESGFGQPELVVYQHSRFYIQLLFWLEGTTAIHQHEFSGAFHVMAGSSIHADFAFENAHAITPHFRTGDVRMKHIELLETGRTVPISSGPGSIHSLFHLDTPSITVVVRTQHDPGTGPQFNYLPPHVALDPVFSDPLTLRRNQLLDVLAQTGNPAYPKLVLKMIADLDFERGFYLLQHGLGYLQYIGKWDTALAAFQKKHGKPAAGIGATLEEEVRRDSIKNLRNTVEEPELRFFLALLMNTPKRADLFALMKLRFPGLDPVETIVRWAGELLEISDEGTAILDARFPEMLDIPIEEQPDIFLAALRHFIKGGKVPTGLSTAARSTLHAVLVESSLGVLSN
ncbi:MAG: hypothetical protein ABIP97_01900 [Chthoniobacterales bacterium]